MKAIALWQPWASLWLSPHKVHETRHWPWTFGFGTVAVHATKHFERNIGGELRAILDDEFGGHWPKDLPTGALIGTVELIDCVPTVKPPGILMAENAADEICGDWYPGRYGLKRGAYRVFKTPIPWKGRQGKYFEVPDYVIANAAPLPQRIERPSGSER